ncbi:MAG: DoxX family protein [Campylobacterota bacterium]|nr:DoxX family protein [Campylobacterota bacterium]
MLFKNIYMEFSRLSEYGQSLALLLARFTIAYGFYEPAMMKWKDISSVAEWFGSMGIPFPTLNAYMAATAEILGVVLLTLGLLTRAISIPLIVVMIVAIVTVHLPNGFSAGDNGFEIPFYYMLFLLIFLTQGAGRFSLDRFIFGEKN